MLAILYAVWHYYSLKNCLKTDENLHLSHKCIWLVTRSFYIQNSSAFLNHAVNGILIDFDVSVSTYNFYNKNHFFIILVLLKISIMWGIFL